VAFEAKQKVKSKNIMGVVKYKYNVIFLSVMLLVSAARQSLNAQDAVADNMVLYQRSSGGWPKQIDNVKLDYTKTLTDQEKQVVRADSMHKDATIDNKATEKEIKYLAGAYKKHNNQKYLAAVNKGIAYLLKAQMPVGGWPQYYPDSSLYRGQITYNDNAMINVLNLLVDASLGISDLDVIDQSYQPAIKNAIERGVNCILRTQIKVNDKLTAWCAQHDRKTLKPTNARKYELVSISGSESVGIVDFLMRLPNPTEPVKQSIAAAVQWLSDAKITGYTYKDIVDPKQPGGRDRLLQPDPDGVVWARFYDIETGKPFFSGRDGEKRWNLMEIEVERRAGYAWYGVWPKNLLEKKYPNWLKKHS
jgi:PelA/Pel-15E family pectate lyase